MTSNQHAQFEMPQGRDTRKKYNTQNDIKTLQRMDYEVEKIFRFLREIKVFEEI